MINVAVIGCGYWSKNIVRNLSKIKNCNIKYLCDSEIKNANFFKENFDLIESSTVSNYKDIRDIDACFIVTPIKTHFKFIKYFMNKCHIFVEKPLCYNLKELKYIIDNSKKNKKLLMTGHIYLYNKGIDKINEIRKNNNSGDILTIYSTRTNLGRVQSDINSLWSFAPHDITIIYKILGKLPNYVSCFGFNLINKKLEDMVYLILHYNDIKVSFQLGWFHPNKIRETIIICKNKIIVFDDVDNQHFCKLIDTRIDNLNEYTLLKKEKLNDFKFNIMHGKTKYYKKLKQEPLLNELKFFLKNLNNSSFKQSELKLSSNFLKIMIYAEKSLKMNGKKFKINYD